MNESAKSWLALQKFDATTHEQYRQLFVAIEADAIAAFRQIIHYARISPDSELIVAQVVLDELAKYESATRGTI